MLSAFGIDHGEIAKARVPRARRPRLTRAQQRTRSQGTPSRTDALKNRMNRIGEADISLKGIGAGIGAGANRAGGFFQRHPGLTGTAAVGGGGAAGYKILSDREPKRRKGTS